MRFTFAGRVVCTNSIGMPTANEHGAVSITLWPMWLRFHDSVVSCRTYTAYLGVAVRNSMPHHYAAYKAEHPSGWRKI